MNSSAAPLPRTRPEMGGLWRGMFRDVSPRGLAVALALVALAVAARAALDTTLPDMSPFSTLYPAVALAGLLCGSLAGALAGALGLVAAIYIWIPPRLSLALPNMGDCVSIGLFVATSAIVLWAAASLRAQRDEAAFARQVLDLGLAAGGVGTWEIDLRTRRIVASRAAYAMHGLTEFGRPTVAEDWLRGVHPDDAAVARGRLEAAVRGGTLATYSYRLSGGADGPRWISARGRVVSSGGERRLLCALVDITEQVRAQDDLARERQRLELALAAGALAVWDYDVGTGEAAVDTRFAATMGFDSDAPIMTRTQIGEWIHPEDRPRVAAEHAARAKAGGEYEIEYRVVTASGDIRWLVSRGIAVQGGAERGRLVGIIQDITARRQREDGLRDLAAARELLVREADHRIKNSLQMVISLLRVQMRGVEDAAAAAALREAITRVGSIAASHLALQGSEDLQEVDMAVSLKELCGHFAQLNPAIAIECHAGEALMLDADRAIPLGLVVSEAITNAMRHAFAAGEAGTVLVEGATETGQLVVRVRDDGVGMPAAERSGLGSRIIRSLAAQVSATMQVESRPGAGTTVTLRLPLQPAVAERAVG